MNSSSKPSVTIVGAGAAGLSAAFKLAEHYHVTLYESAPRVGGNIGSTPQEYANAPKHEVYYSVFPHMYGDWYVNFFSIASQLGLYKNGAFQPCEDFGYVERDRPSPLKFLKNTGSLQTALQNLFSGVVPPADMMLAYYAVLDILTQDFSDVYKLSHAITLNGFLASRPYATEAMAQILQSEMIDIWAVDSYLTSAFAYQCFAKYQARRPTPSNWVLQGDSYECLVKPWESRLKQLGVDIQVDTAVLGVTVDENKVRQLCIRHANDKPAIVPVENLIFAVPQSALSVLIVKTAETAAREAENLEQRRAQHRGQHEPAEAAPPVAAAALVAQFKSDKDEYRKTIASAVPQLANVRNFEYATLAMLYVAFQKELPHIPTCYVALDHSIYALTYIRVPYLEKDLGVPMVLAVGISDFNRIPVSLDGLLSAHDARTPQPISMLSAPSTLTSTTRQDVTVAVLTELQHYLDFDMEDVAFDKTYLKSNQDQLLFLNIVGSRANAPRIHYPEIRNLFFAVGTQENPITIATLECAVYGGIAAAKALWTHHHQSLQHRCPIEPIIPDTWDPWVIWAWKIALTPWAAWAKWWSVCENGLSAARRPAALKAGDGSAGPADLSDLLLAAFDGVQLVGQTAVQAMTASLAVWSSLAGTLQSGGDRRP